MNLELKHLAPYLPYWVQATCSVSRAKDITYTITGLSIRPYGNDTKAIMCSLKNKSLSESCSIKNIKPILRPLSDLTSEFISNCGVNGGFEELHTWGSNYSKGEKQDIITTKGISYASYDDFQILFSMHFDVFGLIEKGLAIDINTVEI